VVYFEQLVGIELQQNVVLQGLQGGREPLECSELTSCFFVSAPKQFPLVRLLVIPFSLLCSQKLLEAVSLLFLLSPPCFAELS